MKESIRRKYRQILILCPILVLILIIVQFVSIVRFNSHVYSVVGDDKGSPTYMELDSRKDSTSSWLKRDFEWKGNTLDLPAQTIDGVFYNNSKDLVDDWTIRINIREDCFINNAWCGTMEIHQYVGTKKEKVQRLDLRNYDLEDVKLAYYYDGDLLIPLRRGDFIIYYPSAKDSEMPIKAMSQITMGVIFYYFDSLDFFDYRIDFTYHRDFSYGVMFDVIVILIVLWLIAGTIYIISLQFYKDAQRQLELKKSGLLCMSDIYLVIFIVDLKNDEIIPVVEQELEGIVRPRDLGANEQFAYLFDRDAAEAYRDLVKEFCDVPTLAERMHDSNSIACEYVSQSLGWCSIRFFAMDRIEGRTPERVLFTIQVIDAEKRAMREIEESIWQTEKNDIARGAFLRGFSGEILDPAHKILDLNEQIGNATRDEAVLGRVKEIDRNGSKLVAIIRDLMDYSHLASDQLYMNEHPLSLKALLYQVKSFAEKILDDGKPIEFQFDIAPTVPERIYGDEQYLMRVLEILVATAEDHTQEGSIRLSLFGKVYDEGAHLVFSVRDTGNGQEVEYSDQIGLRLSSGILERMDSELKIVSSPGSGTEAYFELTARVEGTGTLGEAGLEL
ncbi:MAG: HAMP domain-containing histidine kinase [Lachnospiraceae bacterium]|nr:HAMP domain-containing histidine kinase [Lachnospiraceae bacterium]